jgi:hypothetical protein
MSSVILRDPSVDAKKKKKQFSSQILLFLLLFEDLFGVSVSMSLSLFFHCNLALLLTLVCLFGRQYLESFPGSEPDFHALLGCILFRAPFPPDLQTCHPGQVVIFKMNLMTFGNNSHPFPP